MKDNKRYTVACFGEVLWDVFPWGEMPGGAPMNVGYHLQVFGKAAALITRVGKDRRGDGLARLFSGKGMSTSFFQVDEHYPTGEVTVIQDANKDLSYDIVMPSAWDFISPDPSFEALVSGAGYFVFGTLASRNKTTRDTLLGLLEVAADPFLDVNLRAPHYSIAFVEELLRKSHHVKMNVDELRILTGQLPETSDAAYRIQHLMDRFQLSTVIVTMGAGGAILCTTDLLIKHEGYQITMEDAVGAGDAFLAGYLSRVLDNASFEEALEFACAAGALVASRSGACPEYAVEQVNELITIQNSKTTKIKISPTVIQS